MTTVTDLYNGAGLLATPPYTATWIGKHSQSGGNAVGTSGDERGSLYTGSAFGGNQRTTIKLGTSTASRGAGMLICGSDIGSGFSGYRAFVGFTADWSIALITSGVQIGGDLASGTGGASGTDFLNTEFCSFERSGNDLIFKHKGVTISTVSHTTYMTGSPGIYTYSDMGIDEATFEDDASGTAVSNVIRKAFPQSILLF